MNPKARPLLSFSWLETLALIFAGIVVYSNSLNGSFVYDDSTAIQGNSSIRELSSLKEVLFPAQDGGVTTSGRPLVNLTLALNYAVSGLQVWSYHGFNIAVHILAGLTLFALLRRTWRQPTLAARFGASADWLAFLAALLWLVHPLQTQAVTYIVQRAESLMALCVLFSLYAFVRSTETTSRAAGWWRILSVVACLAGVACKEVAALTPFLALLYDRTFISGSFRQSLRANWPVYLGHIACWAPLAFLLASTGGDRGGTMGFTNGVSWEQFWLTQAKAIFIYLRLSLWPHPLVFDYGRDIPGAASTAWPYVFVILPLAGLTLYALWRRTVLGFVGAWFFIILAPTSLVPSSVQFIVEHRMYLPLAALCALGVGSLQRWMPRLTGTFVILAALVAGALTFARNADYTTEERLWADTVAKLPNNAAALNSLGNCRKRAGDLPHAIGFYQRAIEALPSFILPYQNLGSTFMVVGRVNEAIPLFRRAVALDSEDAFANTTLGAALAIAGRYLEARPYLEKATTLAPGLGIAHLRLAELHLAEGRASEAQRQFAVADVCSGDECLQRHKLPEAAAYYVAALKKAPDMISARLKLGQVLLKLERWQDAAKCFETALALDPNNVEVRTELNKARHRSQ